MNSTPGRFLVVANAYPATDAIYRNPFVHRRVKDYQAAGLDVEVFAVGPAVPRGYTYVYDGVTVHVGNVAEYGSYLDEQPVRKVLIHFAHDYMLEPLRARHRDIPVHVWVHGFETEQWHRRWFNLVDDPVAIRQTLARRDTLYAPQLDFLRWLFTTTELDVTVIQVSEWFRDHISEPDVGAQARQSLVIPNVIDTDLFPYREKDAAARTRILAIRSYASRKYAMDLTVGAIEILADHDFFPNLQFDLYGDGPLRERLTARIAGLPNVNILPTFLRQEDIPGVHAEHGVFLTPTRFDSQGVSMCEAMSSGLVPISTDIAAIPEYVQHELNGLLAAPESAEGVAAQIARLYEDPDLFLTLSAEAAASVRRQCGPEATTSREVELITS
ncbi:glycosyltransferase family 4 protein [Tessaracoccus lapidicaptus]|uniref:glycosyltransferase family 4 protein n=1 Tax=Tessaracoccus lapidicaptus TaxID=1427523 RepID=UPI003340539B